MSAVKHTPGPWQTVATPFKEGFSVLAQPHAALRGFTKVVSFVGDEADEETEANARLIAAAPELLAALKEAEAGLVFAGADADIADGDFVPAPTLALRIVRAAIAKTEGRS